MTISGRPSRTDWERVRKSIEMDAPIPYDPEDGPYDPNDEAETEAYVKQATILVGWPHPVMVKKDGVPVVPCEAPASDESEAHSKAS